MYRQPPTMYGSNDSVRRLSSNNPFRQGLQDLSEDQTVRTSIATSGVSGSSSGTPTQLGFQHTNINTLSLVTRVSPTGFDEWVQKNKQLIDMLSDEEEAYYAHRDSYKNQRQSNVSESESDLFALYGTKSLSTVNSPVKTGFAPPSRPQQPARSGSDSLIDFQSRPVSSNNPFASALQSSTPDPPQATRTSRNGSVPPPRPPKEPNMMAPPPSYEVAAGQERAKAPYRDEKLSSSSSPSALELSSHRPRRSNSEGAARSTNDNQKAYVERSDRDKDKERTRRHHSSLRAKDKLESKSRSSSSKKKKDPVPVKAKNLDTIDKLDVTAFFGGGFHHDGPFDACTPHRNKNRNNAPVMAFPVDGPNNSIKGLGGYNNSKSEQMNLAFGKYDAEADDFNANKQVNPIQKTVSPMTAPDLNPPTSILANNGKNTPSPYNSKTPSVINFDSNVKSEPIHGIVTGGLGSSTFIDGAPAPKSVQDEHAYLASTGALGRKKSIVQRLRKNSSSATSPPNNHAGLYEDPLLPPTTTHHSQELSRRNSADARSDSQNASGGNSFMRRVKSLKVRR